MAHLGDWVVERAWMNQRVWFEFLYLFTFFWQMVILLIVIVSSLQLEIKRILKERFFWSAGRGNTIKVRMSGRMSMI